MRYESNQGGLTEPAGKRHGIQLFSYSMRPGVRLAIIPVLGKCLKLVMCRVKTHPLHSQGLLVPSSVAQLTYLASAYSCAAAIPAGPIIYCIAKPQSPLAFLTAVCAYISKHVFVGLLLLIRNPLAARPPPALAV